jgi:hypothetical protein
MDKFLIKKWLMLLAELTAVDIFPPKPSDHGDMPLLITETPIWSLMVMVNKPKISLL